MHSREPHLPSNHKLSVGHLLIEVVMIVFSILLPLSLESWHEQRKQHELTAAALRAIRTELEANKRAIDASLPLQRAQLASLQKFVDATDQPLRLTTGITPPVHMSSAFETANTTGALNTVGFDAVLAISRAYAARRWMARIEDSWVRVVYSFDAWDQKNVRRSASLPIGALTEYITVETRLGAAYDDVITRMGTLGSL